jgi:hypothetical protein
MWVVDGKMYLRGKAFHPKDIRRVSLLVHDLPQDLFIDVNNYTLVSIRKTGLISKICAFLVPAVFIGAGLRAQIQNYDEPKRGSVYFSVGYDLQFFNASNITIKQESLNNSYVIDNAKATDANAVSAFSPMRLNYKFGYYFNYNQDAGIELSYSPCQYFVTDGQKLDVSGTIGGAKAHSPMTFSKAAGDYYYLYGGAGNIMVNASGRYGIYRKESYNFAVDFIAKAGVGALMPKVQNSLDGQTNTAGVELAGMNIGIETGLRWISHRYYTVELVYKYRYAFLSNIQVYDGWASQNVGSGALALNVGVLLPTTKHNPLFEKGYAHRKRITHERHMYLIDTKY